MSSTWFLKDPSPARAGGGPRPRSYALGLEVHRAQLAGLAQASSSRLPWMSWGCRRLGRGGNGRLPDEGAVYEDAELLPAEPDGRRVDAS